MPNWSILALLAVGACVALMKPGVFDGTFAHAVLYVFLPPLLFEAAWNLDGRIMLTHWRPIFALAVPGVVVTAAMVSSALLLTGFPALPALLTGVIVSATDPITIVAIFQRLPIPSALSTIVQSEALLNDGMAVVLYRVVLLVGAGTLSGETFFIRGLGALSAVAGGLILGSLWAFLIAPMLRRNGTSVQAALTLGGAYLAYYSAEVAHGSGIFAVVAFGVTVREIECRAGERATAPAVQKFWSGAALVANGSVFFLTGAALHLPTTASHWYAALSAVAAVVLARLILAYLLVPVALGRMPNPAWSHVLRAAGARGALCLALAIALPAATVFRGQIIEVTVSVVVATLLLSALEVPRTLRAFVAPSV